MITHQTVGIESLALLGDLAPQQFQKYRAVLVIAKDGLARIPARGDVIQRSGEFQTQRTGNAEMLIRLPYKVKR